MFNKTGVLKNFCKIHRKTTVLESFNFYFLIIRDKLILFCYKKYFMRFLFVDREHFGFFQNVFFVSNVLYLKVCWFSWLSPLLTMRHKISFLIICLFIWYIPSSWKFMAVFWEFQSGFCSCFVDKKSLITSINFFLWGTYLFRISIQVCKKCSIPFFWHSTWIS